jgi:hypothetical protein
VSAKRGTDTDRMVTHQNPSIDRCKALQYTPIVLKMKFSDKRSCQVKQVQMTAKSRHTLLKTEAETLSEVERVQESRRAKAIEKNMVVVGENRVQRQFETQQHIG